MAATLVLLGHDLRYFIFSEILPKNLTVIYRADMIGFLVPPLFVHPFSDVSLFESLQIYHAGNGTG